MLTLLTLCATGHRVFGETVAAYVALDDSKYYNKDFDKASIYCISPPIRGAGELSHYYGRVSLMSVST